ncbi:MAG: holin [Aeriscardovia sp.]|nr:holin [Aeriscardovia sp.]
MKLSDSSYDFLKFLAIHILPALETFWLTVASIWELPYAVQIGATLGAIGMLIGGCIGLSKAAYEKAKQEEYEGNSDAD